MMPVRPRLRFGVPLAALGSLVAAAIGSPGCSQSATSGAVRALQATGPTSFVCLASPDAGDLPAIALPLSECGTDRVGDFSVPHLYALTTQPLRGEVAVVDLTATENPLIDSDRTTPGTNFLPVGANPTDIVSTPGGRATFVTVADPGYEGIFALPSDRIRGGAPTLSSWPACALPEAPTRVALVVDAADANGNVRPACDAAYGDPDPATGCGPDAEPHCHGDLSGDAAAAGTPGRYKLLVSLPKAGGVALIDAQALLDQEGGAFEPCRVERFLPLTVDIAPENVVPPTPKNSCIEPDEGGTSVAGFAAQPAGLAVAERPGGGYRVYVADAAAPTIHRLDLPTACDPVEDAPLLVTSRENPDRIVTTTRVAVSPLTFDLKRYLYAIDDADGSLAVFDVSDGASSRRPLERAHPERNPFQPPDRIRLGSPPREIVLVEARSDGTDSETGSSLPLRCDPAPDASSAAASYQTSADFSSGAGPRKFRGVFGFAVLASGNVVAIDIDDLDSACRGPEDHDPLLGCGDETTGLTGASTEYSCGIVSPHEPRAATYLAFRENVAATQPGLLALPLLFDVDGTVLAPSDEGAARMRATIPTRSVSFDLTLPVGTERARIDATTGLVKGSDAASSDVHVLAMNQDDPRAHLLAQSWSVTWEGSIPGFSSHFGSLVPVSDGRYEFRDPATGFCARGVMGAGAVADELVELEGFTPADATTGARALADYVQIMSDTPVLGDKYWGEQNACSYTACQQTYGTSTNPLVARDLRIDVAKDDVLLVAPRGGAPSPDLKCCFPNVVQFRIRGGGQWIVNGSQVGFLHRTAADVDGVCRARCDSRLARLNGRVREIATDAPIRDDDVRAFINPFFRFAIRHGDATRRDMRFEFATQAPFSPLQVTLVGTSSSTDVQPTAASYLPVTGELVVSDGSLQGLTLLRLDSFAVSRQYQ